MNAPDHIDALADSGAGEEGATRRHVPAMLKTWVARAHRPASQSKMRWAEDLDFLGTTPPAAWWAWVLLAFGVLAVVTLSLERQNLADDLGRADARLRQAQRFEHQAEMRAKLAAAQAAETQQLAQIKLAVSEQTLRAATRLVQQLSYPWAEVLNGVENASGEVALLGLRHDVQSGEVHLDAAVRDDIMALHWVDALSADRTHFEQAYLQSREPLQQPVGELTTRVQLVAVLNPRIEAAVAAAAAARAASAAQVAAAESAASAVATTTMKTPPAPAVAAASKSGGASSAPVANATRPAFPTSGVKFMRSTRPTTHVMHVEAEVRP